MREQSHYLRSYLYLELPHAPPQAIWAWVAGVVAKISAESRTFARRQSGHAHSQRPLLDWSVSASLEWHYRRYCWWATRWFSVRNPVVWRLRRRASVQQDSYSSKYYGCLVRSQSIHKEEAFLRYLRRKWNTNCASSGRRGRKDENIEQRNRRFRSRKRRHYSSHSSGKSR